MATLNVDEVILAEFGLDININGIDGVRILLADTCEY